MAALAAGEAAATDYEWVYTNLCLFPGCSWSAPSFWSPAGYPAGGDRATVDRSIRIQLSENIGAMEGLTLEGGARVHTNGFGLSVTSGNANTFLFGTGATGGNTRLVVDGGAALGIDFIGFFLSMHQGAELRMNGGGAIATFGFNVSQSSLVSGHGTIVLLDGGTRFDIAGTIRPAGGDLLIWSQAADVLDLDGNVGGLEPGFVDVTSTGDLEIRGSLADPFSGEMQVGFRHDIEFDTALEIDGSLRFMSSLGSRLIAPAVTFGDGAQVTVDAAIGHVDAESDWGPNATIELLALTDELHLGQDSYFAASTSWSGRGLLVNEAPAVMSFEDASEVGVAIRNEGVLEIGSTTGFIVLEDLEQAPGAQITVDIEGTMPGVEYDQIYVTGDLTLGGSLQISTPPDYAVEPGNAFEIISVDGVSIGSFDGYAEGDLVGLAGGQDLYITYDGGDGNDVVLYTVPEPGLTIGLAVGLVALASARRRERAGDEPRQ